MRPDRPLRRRAGARALAAVALVSVTSGCATTATTGGAPTPAGPALVEAPAAVVEGHRLRPQARTQGPAETDRDRAAGRRERGGDRTLGRLARRTEALARLPRPVRAAGTVLAPPVPGRSGTGLLLGHLDPVTAPVGGPVDESLTVSVANIPRRTSGTGFTRSMAAISADGQDVLVLNEVGSRSLDALRAAAPGYAAYRDPVPDRSTGGSQSMNNVVMWREDRWNLVDAGRVKVVDDDRGFNRGVAFTWDRYLTWTVLQSRRTGAVVPVVSLHMPTNPVRAPRQPGTPGQTRLQRYDDGMDRVLGVVRVLQAHGPVLLAGDMNSHPTQGSWTAAAKMGSIGYAHVKDRGVMYLFHPASAAVTSARELAIASDHPAVVATVDLRGTGPVG